MVSTIAPAHECPPQLDAAGLASRDLGDSQATIYSCSELASDEATIVTKQSKQSIQKSDGSEAVGTDTRHSVMTLLLDQKAGMSIEDLVSELGVSRTAVVQHLRTLEAEGYVTKTQIKRSKGRPAFLFILTENGNNYFPKKYSWFSTLLVSKLRDELGSERLSKYLFDLGMKNAADAIPRLMGKNRAQRIHEIVRIMNEAGFRAEVIPTENDDPIPRVQCSNCVYHDMARDYPEVCQFDLGFLEGLMGAEVEHQACMHREDDACRFRFVPLLQKPKGDGL